MRETLAHVIANSWGKAGSSAVCLQSGPVAPGLHPPRSKSTVKGAMLSRVLWPRPQDLL